jgi:hypothetical protein
MMPMQVTGQPLRPSHLMHCQFVNLVRDEMHKTNDSANKESNKDARSSLDGKAMLIVLAIERINKGRW